MGFHVRVTRSWPTSRFAVLVYWFTDVSVEKRGNLNTLTRGTLGVVVVPLFSMVEEEVHTTTSSTSDSLMICASARVRFQINLLGMLNE